MTSTLASMLTDLGALAVFVLMGPAGS